MAFDDLEKKLYGPKEKAEGERPITESTRETLRQNVEAPEEWSEQEIDGGSFSFLKMAKKYQIRKFLFRGALVISGVVLIVVAYLLYQAFTFSGISLQMDFEEPVLAGVPFTVTLSYSNNSPSLLTNAKLLLTLPTEFTFVDGDASRRVQSEDVGTVGVGTIGQKTFEVVALRGEGSCADIVASLEYNTAGVGSRFEKKAPKSVCVSTSAVALNVAYANQVLSNETFDMQVTYENVSDETLRGLELRLEYPQNFTFQSATLKPDLGDNVWRLGDLRPGSSGEILVRGSVIAQQDSFFEIKIKLLSKTGVSEYIVAEKVATISISPPPLSITVAVQGSTDHIVRPGELLAYTLEFKNTTDIGFRDVVIKAKLVGEMFDLASINPKANLNTITKELSWNKSHLGILGLVPPGASGVVSFEVRVLDTFPIKRLSDKDFSLKINAEIDSPTVPPFVSAERTISIGTLETKVSGLLTIESRALFRDATSGIVNSGPLPPRANTPTNYTIHWIVRNYGTDVASVEIRAFLTPGVRGTGVVKSNIESSPTYNDRTQEMIWNIPKIQATRGVISEPIEGIFQIEALPALNQVGNPMPLIGETKISALDLFTDLNLNYTAPDIDTSLNGNDPTVKFDEARVAP